MSESVEMMLEGIVCMQCGQVIDCKATGFPRQCKECEEKRFEELDEENDKKNKMKKELEDLIGKFV